MKPLTSVLDSRALRRACIASLAVVAAVWLAIRFIGLDKAPHGFWMDEAWDAVQVMCLAENGHDADGKAWPLISTASAVAHSHSPGRPQWSAGLAFSVHPSRHSDRCRRFGSFSAAPGCSPSGAHLSSNLAVRQQPATGNSGAAAFPWLFVPRWAHLALVFPVLEKSPWKTTPHLAFSSSRCSQ